MSLNIADLKQQVEEAAAKFADQLMWPDFTQDQSLFDEYLKAINDMRKEGWVYHIRIVKHKTKRGYSPKHISYKRLYGIYRSEVVIDGGAVMIHNYIHPLPILERIKVEVLNEGIKTI